jgi:putative MATE family efflux protein
MLSVSRDEITSGSLARSLVVLAVPLVIQNLVQVVQNVVDTFWLGRLGENAVAAVGLALPVITLALALVIGLITGTQVLVSQRVGNDDVRSARRAAFHGVTLGLVVTVVLAVVVALTARDLTGLLTSDATVANLAAAYLTVYTASFVVSGISDPLEGSFIGFGDSRAALYVNVTAVLVNVILDPFLIFGYGPFPELGVEGAALASVAGYGCGMVLAIALLSTNRNEFTFTRRTVEFDLAEYRELVAIGYPNALQHGARHTARLLIVSIVASVGGAAGLAAYTVGARIAAIAYIPAWGLQQAAQSVVGQNLGAEKPGRADRATWIGVAIAVTGLLVVGAVQAVIPGHLTTLFVPDLSPLGFQLTVDYLQILALGYWAIGAMMMFTAAFNGARRTRTSMVATMTQFWGVRLPFAAIGALTLGFGVYAVFWSVTVSNVAAAIGAGLYYVYTARRGMFDRAAERASGTPSD